MGVFLSMAVGFSSKPSNPCSATFVAGILLLDQRRFPHNSQDLCSFLLAKRSVDVMSPLAPAQRCQDLSPSSPVPGDDTHVTGCETCWDFTGVYAVKEIDILILEWGWELCGGEAVPPTSGS